MLVRQATVPAPGNSNVREGALTAHGSCNPPDPPALPTSHLPRPRTLPLGLCPPKDVADRSTASSEEAAFPVRIGPSTIHVSILSSAPTKLSLRKQTAAEHAASLVLGRLQSENPYLASTPARQGRGGRDRMRKTPANRTCISAAVKRPRKSAVCSCSANADRTAEGQFLRGWVPRRFDECGSRVVSHVWQPCTLSLWKRLPSSAKSEPREHEGSFAQRHQRTKQCFETATLVLDKGGQIRSRQIG